MKAGIQAIIQKIGMEAELHGGERHMQIKNDIDGEISAENRSYLDDLSKRREMLKKNNELEYTRRLERLTGRLNREILMYQHNLIDEIFEQAAAKLREAPKKEFAEMFLSATKTLKGSFKLRLGEFSAHKLDLADIEAAAKQNGTLEIVLEPEPVPQKSGFVLSDERVEYSCLFEDLIEDKKAGQAALILKEVFGNFEARLEI